MVLVDITKQMQDRKPGEAIHIGSEITVTVVSVGVKFVRLMVQAPRNVRTRVEFPGLEEDNTEIKVSGGPS